MKYDLQKHHRQSIRLQGYDYSKNGAYFITICTQNRECLFGKIVDGVMRLNDAGQNAKIYWENIPDHYPFVVLDEYVVMPNHIHGIVIIDTIVNVNSVGANDYSPPQRITNVPQQRPNGTSKTIGAIVRGFKIGGTKWFRINTDIDTVWQRNYYEHIIRNEDELNRIREYIINNPRNWKTDKLFLQ